ncbi:MAG: cation diffusion facilitator family transporter [Anaerolineales bacterium]|nr:cation diffusion facilitator family transporter [Anaerolineales bacterium]
MQTDQISEAEKEKKNAALSSVVAAVFLTVLKIVIGILTGSLGILAEAAHSGLDLIAALVTFFAVRISDQPPDKKHLYGHGKVENLSALVETLLLLLTCIWIIYEAIQRLFFETVEIEVSIWAFGVMGVSIIIDITRSRILYKAARKHNSQALEADALHFSTDIWSSSVVIVGLGLVWLSERLGSEWIWLEKGDAVAALVVAMIVVYVSVQLGKRAISVLLDTAPPGLVEEIIKQASGMSGVQAVKRVRARQAGASVFVDLTIDADRSASLEEAHQIATAVGDRIGNLIGVGDVVVHVDPVQKPDENLAQTVSAIAARWGLRTHNVHAHVVRDQYAVDLHIEVPSNLTLEKAHQQVTLFEKAVRQELPGIWDIHSHIEPVEALVADELTLESDKKQEIQNKVDAFFKESETWKMKRLLIRPDRHSYELVLHVWADPDLDIVEAHDMADTLERQLLTRIPGISSVLVHVEPKR